MLNAILLASKQQNLGLYSGAVTANLVLLLILIPNEYSFFKDSVSEQEDKTGI